jgi:hypothetical protein
LDQLRTSFDKSRSIFTGISSGISGFLATYRYFFPSEKKILGPDLTLIYNTAMAAMEIENSLPPELALHHDAMAAGDKLYAFGTYSGDNGGVHCLHWTKPDDIRPPLSHNRERDGSLSGDNREEDLPHSLRSQPRWAWERIPAPSAF